MNVYETAFPKGNSICGYLIFPILSLSYLDISSWSSLWTFFQLFGILLCIAISSMFFHSETAGLSFSDILTVGPIKLSSFQTCKPKLSNKFKLSNQNRHTLSLSLSVGLYAAECFAIDRQSLVLVVLQVHFRIFENMI